MKRLVSFAVILLMTLTIFACSSPIKSETSRKNGLNCSFESSVNITIDNLDAEAVLKRFGEGLWDIEFSSPNTLSGVKLEFDSGNVSASYKGLDFSVPQSALPVKSLMLNLIEVIDSNARLEELKGTENDNVLELNGSLDAGEYVLSVGKDGKPVSFEMENNNFKIIFSDFKELEFSAETTTETIINESSSESITTSENPAEVIEIPEQDYEEVVEIPESEPTIELIE